MTRMGLSAVDLHNVGYKIKPFVLAKDVLQVFYVPDTVRTMRHIILPGKRRIIGVQNTVDEEEFNQFDEISPFATCELSRLTANDKTPYLRTDHNKKNLCEVKVRLWTWTCTWAWAST